MAMTTLAVLAACGGDKAGSVPATADSAKTTAAAPAPSAGPIALGEPTDGNGRVIEVKLITDEQGNRFEPNVVDAKEHDVLRFVMVTGVHNVDFLASRNPGVAGLPAPSELLQTPGQAKEYVVGLKPGSYYFQCDPHAALGMTGTLKVSE